MPQPDLPGSPKTPNFTPQELQKIYNDFENDLLQIRKKMLEELKGLDAVIVARKIKELRESI